MKRIETKQVEAMIEEGKEEMAAEQGAAPATPETPAVSFHPADQWKDAGEALAGELGDLSAGVYDAQGRMLAQAVTGTPGHVNAMADAVAREDYESAARLRDQLSDLNASRSIDGTN